MENTTSIVADPSCLKRSSSLSSFFNTPPPSPIDATDQPRTSSRFPPMESGDQEIDQDIAQLTAQMSELGHPRGEPDACIFVASLSAQSSDEQLQEDVIEHFGQWGPILSVKVSRDWMNRPFAFVQYEKVRDAHTALKLGQHTMLNRRKLRLEKARVNRTLFISRWPRELLPSEVHDILETFGAVEDLNLLRHRGSEILKGTGFVKYRYRDDAIKAFSGLRHHYKWTVDWASQYPPSPCVTSGYGGRRMSSGELDLHTLFFGNLEASITEEYLFERVSEFGPVESVQLVRKAESRPAFAFVRFLNDQDAEAALTALDSQDWNGRPVKIPQRPCSTMMDSGPSARLPLYALPNSPLPRHTLRHSREYKTADEAREEDLMDFLLDFDGDSGQHLSRGTSKGLKKCSSASNLSSSPAGVGTVIPSVPLPSGEALLCPFPRKGVSVTLPTPKNCLVIQEEEEVSEMADQLNVARLNEVDLSSSMKARNEFFEIVRPSKIPYTVSKKSLPRHHSKGKKNSPSCTKGFGLAF